MSDDTIQTTFWLMIAIQTIGSVDMPGSGNRKMPAPRAYVATVVLWAILGVVAETRHKRLAEQFSWFVVLVGMVVGPFGARVTGLFNSVASNYGSTQTLGQGTAQGVKDATGGSRLPSNPLAA